MTRSLVAALAALAALLPASETSAQSRVASAMDPRRAAACGKERLETVLVVDSAGNRNPFLAAPAAEVSYWFRPAPAYSARNTSFALTLRRDGAAVTAGSPSGDADFDRAARQAVDAALHEHAFDRVRPREGEPPVRVAVHFGQDATGRQLKPTARTVCDAVSYESNPNPMFPQEFLPPTPGSVAGQLVVRTRQITSGEVVARFLVDSLGVVDPASFAVVRSTDPLFVREVKAVLPRLRFYPAEIGGRRAAEVIEQTFDFRIR